ncbi:hypothetical protein [Polynucleobacter necessarius]|uniref:hypothetical protein n=1 Tax=Polynucleobacter necessarius TaxID=576610 RepID=UPI001E64DBEA|nr:hypothetical protein [Polynucleobacter necessarius]
MAALPPLSPEAQEAANLAKAKTAYGDRVGAYKLCLAQNKVADQFRVAGTPAPAACVAPLPFVPPGSGCSRSCSSSCGPCSYNGTCGCQVD